ncbi:hypothetical protein OBJ96_12535 [Empedobacter falsenii]
MNTIDLTTFIFPNNRVEFRKKLINLFLDEKPGTGKGNLSSRNHYRIKIINNHEVYLRRPAQLNNGLDFTLNVSNINFNEGLVDKNG